MDKHEDNIGIDVKIFYDKSSMYSSDIREAGHRPHPIVRLRISGALLLFPLHIL
jgi:hypothetical protein